MPTAEHRRARRAGRALLSSVGAVLCAALVQAPWVALVLCLFAVAAAGAFTGTAGGRAPRLGAGIHLRERPSPRILSLGALGYLIGLPATWRALSAVEDLSGDSASSWRWVLLLAALAAFVIGYGLGARRVHTPEGSS